MTAMQVDPDERFQTADEKARDRGSVAAGCVMRTRR
jgi:hypothetical protein